VIASSAFFILVAAGIVIGLCALSMWRAYSADRERRRIAHEVQLAEWQLRQISRAAMRAMLDEARRSQGGGPWQ
jgi:type II secretory pathway pseudopilin PulG